MAQKKRISSIFICLFAYCLVFSFCRPKQAQVEKVTEGGIEVVINHQEPHRMKGEPGTFSLEEEFRIDTESEDLAELGIKSIEEFEVDAEGNVFPSTGEQVFKFDGTGQYVGAVGRRGQGPGEYQMALGLRIMRSSELSFYDSENAKFLFFGPEGAWIKDIKKTSPIFTFEGACLDNGHYILRERLDDPKKGMRSFQYALLDENFEKIKNFRPTFWIEIPYFQPAKINLLGHDMSCRISHNVVFVASNMEENLEIEVYNFEGDLVRKIRRKAEKQKVTDEYKEKTLKRWQQSRAWKEWNLDKKHYFSDTFPPFKQFWVDDEARVFVETYEEGEKPGDVLLDIFDTRGVFVGVKSLKEARDRRFKNNHMYAVYRKESGYDVLVGYNMIWK